MESAVWNKLPADIQILVLLWLPLLDLRRFSFTCKYFHKLLSDPAFAVEYDRHRLADTVILTSTRLEQRMEKTVLNSVIWQQRRNFLFRWQSPLFDGSSWWLSGCSYGDGFVCLRSPHKKLFVVNPLLPHQSKMLTLPEEYDSAVGILNEAIAYDRKNGACKLIFWGKLWDDRIVSFVYTFKEGVWKTIKGCNGTGKSFVIWGCPQLVNERFLCWRCTDSISSANTVLVFDVENDMWKEPIPLGNGSFSCIIQHEKQLCVISKKYEKEETIFELWKFDLKQRVLQLLEIIPPPTTGERECWGDPHSLWVGQWSPGFFRVEEYNAKEVRCCTWVYDISQHSWQCLGPFEIGYACFEGSLFRLAV